MRNHPIATSRARNLRKRLTPQEVKLWVKLRELKAQGLHFRRQVPRAGYIVDFACPRRKVMIEVDGAQHGFDTHRRRDRVRDAKLTADGFFMLRFWNHEIDDNLDGVVETIFAACMRAASRASGRCTKLA
jgi:very-short-patch-repair endonuclease